MTPPTALACISLWAPWSAAIEAGIKTIETRSWRAPRHLWGARIGIHTTKTTVGLRHLRLDHVDADGTRHSHFDGDTGGTEVTWRTRGGLVAALHHDGTTTPITTGALIATATLVASVPMEGGDPTRVADPAAGGLTIDETDDRILLRLWRPGRPDPTDVSDQAPYGHFAPGRHAWILDDIAPVRTRCPDCWGTRRRRGWHCGCGFGVRHLVDCGRPAPPCVTCNGAGGCDPIRTDGHQGIWYWTPELGPPTFGPCTTRVLGTGWQ